MTETRRRIIGCTAAAALFSTLFAVSGTPLGGQTLLCGSGVVNEEISGAATIDDDNAVVFASTGDDTITVTAANVTICALGGNDEIDATNASGPVTVFGGPGNDLLRGSAHADGLFAGAGEDSVLGLAGADIIRGGNGHDWLFGGNGDDLLGGGSGRDVMRGGNGDDLLVGSSYKDQLFGESGDDSLYGGGGDDRLDGGPGFDQLEGRLGNDILFPGLDDQADFLDCGLWNRDVVQSANSDDIAHRCENPGQATVYTTPTTTNAEHRCLPDISQCRSVTGTSGLTVLALGDSHTVISTANLNAWGAANDLTVYQAAKGSCGWVTGVSRGAPHGSHTAEDLANCVYEQRSARPALIDAIDPDIIVLFSRTYETHPVPGVLDANGNPSGRSFDSHVIDTLAYYRDAADVVIVIDPVPTVELPEISPAACLDQGRTDCDFTPTLLQSTLATYAFADHYPTIVPVSFNDIICPNNNCPAIINGLEVRYDGNHLTPEFLEYLRPTYIERMNAAIATLDD